MKSKTILKFTLLSLAFLGAADYIFIPISAEIFAIFPDENQAILNMLITVSLFACVAGALLSGVLAKRVSKKYILVASELILLVGGVFGGAIENVYYMLIMRMLVGLGYGSGGVVVISLITELFRDEKERSTLVGVYNGIAAAFGVACSLLAGFLAVINWHYSFLVYAIIIPILILTIVFVPKTKPDGKTAQEEDGTGPREKVSWVKLGAVAIAVMMFQCIFCIVSYFLALYLAEMGIGDAATAGMYTSFITIGQFISGFIFAIIFMRLHRAMPVLLFGVMGLAYLGMYVFPNAGVIGVAVAILGCIEGLGMSFYYMHAETIVPANSVSLSVSVVASALGLGGFLSSYAIIGYQAMMGTEAIAPTFLPVAITALICAGISVVLAIRASRTSKDSLAA
ncbi:MFS transporter [Adlercreutzia sp. R7]|uniref:MFS transporter n=1 Tax=Adlercreutzia wanghongyangiae TaxID=3111451 RepID=A0ABU6IK85_9ACTN|nr:MFS transporter [Adlercreutzia sp. R7]